MLIHKCTKDTYTVPYLLELWWLSYGQGDTAVSFSHGAPFTRPLTCLYPVLNCQYPLHDVLGDFVFWSPCVCLWVRYEWEGWTFTRRGLAGCCPVDVVMTPHSRFKLTTYYELTLCLWHSNLPDTVQMFHRKQSHTPDEDPWCPIFTKLWPCN